MEVLINRVNNLVSNTKRLVRIISSVTCVKSQSLGLSSTVIDIDPSNITPIIDNKSLQQVNDFAKGLNDPTTQNSPTHVLDLILTNEHIFKEADLDQVHYLLKDITDKLSQLVDTWRKNQIKFLIKSSDNSAYGELNDDEKKMIPTLEKYVFQVWWTLDRIIESPNSRVIASDLKELKTLETKLLPVIQDQTKYSNLQKHFNSKERDTSILYTSEVLEKLNKSNQESVSELNSKIEEILNNDSLSLERKLVQVQSYCLYVNFRVIRRLIDLKPNTTIVSGAVNDSVTKATEKFFNFFELVFNDVYTDIREEKQNASEHVESTDIGEESDDDIEIIDPMDAIRTQYSQKLEDINKLNNKIEKLNSQERLTPEQCKEEIEKLESLFTQNGLSEVYLMMQDLSDCLNKIRDAVTEHNQPNQQS